MFGKVEDENSEVNIVELAIFPSVLILKANYN